MTTVAVIVAAGSGRRMRAELNKVLLPLLGRPLVQHSLEAFERADKVDRVVLVARNDEIPVMKDLCRGYRKVAGLVAGGAERQDSVRNAVEWLIANGAEDGDRVLVHDGARPLANADLINRCLEAIEQAPAAIPALPVRETVKRVMNGRIVETLERQDLVSVQTPQAFRLGALRRAHREALAAGDCGTDDASLVERLGMPVVVVQGDPRNIKVTTPEDLVIVTALLVNGGTEK